MKLQKNASIFVLACFMLTACKNDVSKKVNTKEVLAAASQKVSLNISGMTCEIGCAKTIQSKLSKKEGIINANVVFKDSIANIEFDASKVSKTELIAFIDGIAGGELYRASEGKEHSSCGADCKKACCANKEVKKCEIKCDADCTDKDCKKCAAKKAECVKKCDAKKQKSCKKDCKKSSCEGKEKKECKKECKKACCADDKKA